MERYEALRKAEGRSMTTRETVLVICRTDHPHVEGDYYYVIPESAKVAWTHGEYVVDAFNDGESVECDHA